MVGDGDGEEGGQEGEGDDDTARIVTVRMVMIVRMVTVSMVVIVSNSGGDESDVR